MHVTNFHEVKMGLEAPILEHLSCVWVDNTNHRKLFKLVESYKVLALQIVPEN